MEIKLNKQKMLPLSLIFIVKLKISKQMVALITKHNQIINIQMFHMLLSIKLSSLGRIVAINIFPIHSKKSQEKAKRKL